MTKPMTKTQPYIRDQVWQFVAYVYTRKEKDPVFGARMRQALRPTLAMEAWGYLVPFVDISLKGPRTVFTLIGASIAFEKGAQMGTCGLGQVLSHCHDSDCDSMDEKMALKTARLRRLLASRSTEGLCRTLKPLLTLIRNRCPGQLDYALLLEELLSFEYNEEKIKARWIQDFYSQLNKEEE